MEIGSLVEKSEDERSLSETVDQIFFGVCLFALGLQIRFRGNSFVGRAIWNIFINVGVFWSEM